MSQAFLSQAGTGDRCLVLDILPKPAALKSRLYALGIIPGSALRILRVAPLGDPIQVKAGSSFLSIRKTEADIIHVEIQ
ncbi:MAG: FeoA family protein [Pseudohongiellaceae bacterium]